MGRISGNLLTRAFTIILIAGVSLCCCQARLIMTGVAMGETCAVGGSVDGAAMQCCSTTRPDDEQPSTPVRDCGGCCLKAVNLDTGVKALPTLILTGLVAPAAIESSQAQPQLSPAGNDVRSSHGGIAPPTLLRLRCALII